MKKKSAKGKDVAETKEAKPKTAAKPKAPMKKRGAKKSTEKPKVNYMQALTGVVNQQHATRPPMRKHRTESEGR